jgi:hypothetical protein
MDKSGGTLDIRSANRQRPNPFFRFISKLARTYHSSNAELKWLDPLFFVPLWYHYLNMVERNQLDFQATQDPLIDLLYHLLTCTLEPS